MFMEFEVFYVSVLILSLIIPTAVAVVYVVMFLILPMARGAVYVPSKQERVRTMIKLLDLKKGDKAIDVGSGDGRVVIEMARSGADAYGIEINPFLVLWSRYRIKRHGFKKRPRIYWKNQWSQNFEEFNKISVYGISYIMKDLEKKFQKELKPGSLVASNAFTFPTWKAEKEEGELGGIVRLYRKN
ncbi:MAG: hypothetical protein A3B96_02510 [Candidatus Spechtbacteria bacterium RIFCSPHIGHO2_02_FULL_43_15b]|uniref:Methyltransferase domain-containing protein n=1 Tax=Candidatus Spechtbacteria bacterium RIFCSPHIGHO2_01_FULL_43_30 TaxID=1802158 RepID=A0A1G2H6L0_9BACT|nr:MAG: hypothetical protein A2827_02665 [Candidatus Spechtbacteria bacterium RIFCSPHIGHO2_01_FULL_43_30]OGZ60173.1 MAG: hypothetical protein A3B96_02510 [Candidatus Spechtbacteria bacterium RIFCSPHIGHO2_02_FULL_43_15b]